MYGLGLAVPFKPGGDTAMTALKQWSGGAGSVPIIGLSPAYRRPPILLAPTPTYKPRIPVPTTTRPPISLAPVVPVAPTPDVFPVGGGSAPGTPVQTATPTGNGGFVDTDTGAPIATAGVFDWKSSPAPLIMLGLAGLATYMIFGNKKGR